MSAIADDGRPVSDGQWEAMEKIVANGGQAWVVAARTKVGRHSITKRTAAALSDRGFITVTGTTARITDAGTSAVELHRRITGRRPS